ncbi:MAG: hypothetical protein GWN67_27575 [Phycisphaerae bacterium]|nr:hypothetical protein [Phycisphaerae bacterium]NIR66388.1 hypothetical protein [candidate division Zixibacteria bacterium]NIP55892.1 hypothetical protein [Phycisphaerae bacterium]NIS54472.1 hypothetical protein [Phycisphaerae bacterium]NIU12107.1 hypothetical protein [Phycisphaerae bacterium]
MRPAENIEKFIKRVRFRASTQMHERTLKDALEAQEKSRKTKSAEIGPNIWRIIMKSRITKLATAAVIVLAVVLSVTILNQTATPVWAIDQSIEAIDKYNAVVIEGLESERTWMENGSLELRPYKSWAVANKDQTMIEKYRTEVEGFLILTTNGQKTWRYDPKTNKVHIENRAYIASECWFGSRFLEQIKALLGKVEVKPNWEVTFSKDPSTGKQRAFLKIAWLAKRYNGPRSICLEFDVESKLPVSLKQWENANWEGPATLIAKKITYLENLPDDLFEFEIPEGATVIEE